MVVVCTDDADKVSIAVGVVVAADAIATTNNLSLHQSLLFVFYGQFFFMLFFENVENISIDIYV